MGMKRDKKDDEDNGGTGGGHPYSNLEKTSVLQEARLIFALFSLLVYFLLRVNLGRTLMTILIVQDPIQVILFLCNLYGSIPFIRRTVLISKLWACNVKIYLSLTLIKSGPLFHA